MRAEGFLREQKLLPAQWFFLKFDMAQFKYSAIVEFCFGIKR